MPTRNVVLTDHQQELIETLVQSGRYQNSSEVVRAGLRLIERSEAEFAARAAALREALAIGVASLERGEGVSFDDDEALSEYLNRIADEDQAGLV
jgi:antitoxin ParD1/3/4